MANKYNEKQSYEKPSEIDYSSGEFRDAVKAIILESLANTDTHEKLTDSLGNYAPFTKVILNGIFSRAKFWFVILPIMTMISIGVFCFHETVLKLWELLRK